MSDFSAAMFVLAGFVGFSAAALLVIFGVCFCRTRLEDYNREQARARERELEEIRAGRTKHIENIV